MKTESRLIINLEGLDLGDFRVVDNLPNTIVAKNVRGTILYFNKDCAQTREGITYLAPLTDNQMKAKFGQVHPFHELHTRMAYKLMEVAA